MRVEPTTILWYVAASLIALAIAASEQGTWLAFPAIWGAAAVAHTFGRLISDDVRR